MTQLYPEEKQKSSLKKSVTVFQLFDLFFSTVRKHQKILIANK